MDTGILDTASIVAYIFAGIWALVSVILFFKMNVRAIIDDLSGKKAQRQMQAYREQGLVNRRRVGAISEQRNYYNPVHRQKGESMSQTNQTEVLQGDATAILRQSEQPDAIEYTILFDEMIIHTGEEI